MESLLDEGSEGAETIESESYGKMFATRSTAELIALFEEKDKQLKEMQSLMIERQTQLTLAAEAGLVLHARVQTLTAQIEENMESYSSMESQVTVLMNDAEHRVQKERELLNQIGDLSEAKSSLEFELREAKQAFSDRMNTLNRELENRKAELEELYSIMEKSEAESTERQERHSSEIRTLRNDLSTKQVSIARLQANLDEVERDLVAFRAMTVSNSNVQKGIEVQLAEARVKCLNLKEEKNTLESDYLTARTIIDENIKILIGLGLVSAESKLGTTMNLDLDELLEEMQQIREKSQLLMVTNRIPNQPIVCSLARQSSIGDSGARFSSDELKYIGSPISTPIFNRNIGSFKDTDSIPSLQGDDWATATEVEVSEITAEPRSMYPSQSGNQTSQAQKDQDSSMHRQQSFGSLVQWADYTYGSMASGVITAEPLEQPKQSGDYDSTVYQSKLFSTSVTVIPVLLTPHNPSGGTVMKILSTTVFYRETVSYERVVFRKKEDILTLRKLLRVAHTDICLPLVEDTESESWNCKGVELFLNEICSMPKLACSEFLRVFLTSNYDSWKLFCDTLPTGRRRKMTMKDFAKAMKQSETSYFSDLVILDDESFSCWKCMELKVKALSDELNSLTFERLCNEQKLKELRSSFEDATLPKDEHLESGLARIEKETNDSVQKERETTEKLEILRIETQQLKEILFKDPIEGIQEMLNQIKFFVRDINVRVESVLKSKMQLLPEKELLWTNLSHILEQTKASFAGIGEHLSQIISSLGFVQMEHAKVIRGYKESLLASALSAIDGSYDRLSSRIQLSKTEAKITTMFKMNIERRFSCVELSTRMSLHHILERMLDVVMHEQIQDEYSKTLLQLTNAPNIFTLSPSQIDNPETKNEPCDLIIRYCHVIKDAWTISSEDDRSEPPQRISTWKSLLSKYVLTRRTSSGAGSKK